MEITDLLQSLEIYDKKYKRDEIDKALIRREEITPHLIAILEKVLQDPGKYAGHDSDYWGHIYAFMLLGHLSGVNYFVWFATIILTGFPLLFFLSFSCCPSLVFLIWKR